MLWIPSPIFNTFIVLPPKISVPIDSVESGIVMVSNLELPLNAPLSIFTTPFPILSVVNGTFENAASPMYVTALGIVTFSSAEPLKAYEFIVFKLSGKTSFFNAVHLLNAYSSIVSIFGDM